MTRINTSRRQHSRGLRLLCAAIIWGFGCNVALGQSTGSNEGGTVPQPVPVFPASNWWNTDISKAPVDPASASYIKYINNGGTRTLHPDFGGKASGTYGVYGFPYVVVDGVAGPGKSPPALQAVQFHYASQSDGVNHSTNTAFPFYPIPTQAETTPRWIECGDPGTVDDRNNCDRHLLIIDRDNKYLYEMWNVWYDSATNQWLAGSGAFWDMKTNNQRPTGWTSADAAGLEIFPGLVRYDEVYNAYGTNVSTIDHAFRVTVRSSDGYVYPASHDAGSTKGALPMGARLRLKGSFDISGFNPEMQKIFKAMKTYGLIVADNGSDMYISGTYDTHWNNNVLNPAFGKLSASDFEVVKLGWKSTLSSVDASSTTMVGGATATGTMNLFAAAPTGGITVNLSTTNTTLSVPTTVFIPAGATSATFTIDAGPVSANTKTTIVGDYTNSEVKTTVTVQPAPVLTTLDVNPTAVTGGSNATGTVDISIAAPTGGASVTLTSSAPGIASVPKMVKIAKGATTGTFSVTSKTQTKVRTTTITASYLGVNKTAVLTVNP